MADLVKIAEVLEKAAAVIDAHETEKQAAVSKEREAALKLVAEKYAEFTGEDLPEEIRSKLASSDGDIVEAFKKVVEKTAGAVESLGRSSEKQASENEEPPRTKKEAREAAFARFGRFINS